MKFFLLVPFFACPVLATSVCAFVPDAFPSLASPVVAPRLHRLRQGLYRHRLPPLRLPRLCHTDFVFAYSVLAKPEYAFIPDVRLLLAKPWPHLVLDGSDCIGFSITLSNDFPDTSPSFYWPHPVLDGSDCISFGIALSDDCPDASPSFYWLHYAHAA